MLAPRLLRGSAWLACFENDPSPFHLFPLFPLPREEG